MERPRRTHAEARAEMRAGILRLGRAQLAERGAAGLSVREIARGLGVASSAIYRHVENRDALLTLLLVEAYTDLADTALAGDDPEKPPRSRLAALARGMRAWAVADPARWALAYGSPVPGYAAPAEQTTGPGTRVMAAFLGLLSQAGAPLGCARSEAAHDPAGDPGSGCRTSPLSAELAAELEEGATELGIAAPPELAAAGIEAWTGLIGLISAEAFGQLGPDLARHGEELLGRWIDTTADLFGLR